jgi:hypothetical protein
MAEVSWGPDEPTVRLTPPADPWAHTQEMPTVPQERPRRRQIFGRVYETIETGQRDAEHRYVGKTEQTIHQRVHGPSGHTSQTSIARDPWKANILLGKAGYRLLENVYDTGDPAENDRALRRAEAFWIDHLRPTRNVIRPVRPPSTAPPPPRREPRPRRAPRRISMAEERKRRRVRVRLIVLSLIVVACAYAVARAVMLLHLPWPAAPYVAGVTVGGLLGWRIFSALLTFYRKLARS